MTPPATSSTRAQLLPDDAAQLVEEVEALAARVDDAPGVPSMFGTPAGEEGEEEEEGGLDAQWAQYNHFMDALRVGVGVRCAVGVGMRMGAVPPLYGCAEGGCGVWCAHGRSTTTLWMR